MLALASVAALALDPSQPTASYLRTTFTVEDGLSANVVNAIVQTRSGFLWIGTDSGLDRFNGRHFIPVYFRGPKSAPQGIVRALAESPDGSLWIGTNVGLVRIPSDALDRLDSSSSVVYHPGPGMSDEINCLHVDHQGTLWVGTNWGMYRFGHGTFNLVLPRFAISRIESTADGHLLVVTGKGFFDWDGKQFVDHPGLLEELGVGPEGLFHAFQDHSGTMWYCTGAGVAHRIGNVIRRYEPYGVPGAQGAIRVYEDKQANLWTYLTSGLFRATEAGLDPLAPGLSPRTIFGDRDGNLWVGTNGEGLIRFKDRPVRMFTKADGMPNNVPMTVLVRRDGSLWVGNNCGGLSVFDGQRFKTFAEKDGLSNSCVWSLAEDRNNDLWIGTYGGGLFRLSGGKFTRFSMPEGVAGDVVRAIVVASDGSLWIATEDGLSHLQNGHFRNYTVADGLSSDRVISVYQDRHGGIWAGTFRGIDRMIGDRFTHVSSAQEISAPRYLSFGEDRSGDLYALSAPKGLDRFSGNQFVNVNQDLDLLNILSSREQDIWFSGGNGIFRVPAEALHEAGREHDAPLDYASFGRADGLLSTQCSIGAPNMAMMRDRKLWVTTVQGLAMLDLPRLARTTSKPDIFVEEVTVGRTRQPAGRELVLTPGTHHVEFHFDAISLASAEKVRFQYRLEGVDPVWLDADSLRTAVYTSIPLGTHAFHLRACNTDGVWDRAGILYSVTQRPYFHETSWFRLGAAAAFLLLLAAGYRFRLAQVTSQMHARLDERVAERTRVARELHDTLLQTIQGSKMVADDALDHAGDLERMRRAVERLSGWLAQATREGRAVLSSLRTSTTQTNDLAAAFRGAGDGCIVTTSMTFTLTVDGTARDMHPIVRDDVYRIGYEAIRNACKHSEGSRLAVELSYARDLVLRVSDDGRGIDPEVLAKGKDGHFGLKGIEERAARIGARLSLRSTRSGTEVELIVPGSLAFRRSKPARHTVVMKLRRLFRVSE